MSVFVVTRDGAVIEYGREGTWLRRDGPRWKIYYKTCKATCCSTEKHELLVAYVRNCDITSIGFDKPDVARLPQVSA